MNMTDMTDSFKKVFLAGIGAVATTADKAQEVVEELVKKGEITTQQGKELMNEFTDKTKQNLNFVKREEFDELKTRVQELENKLNNTGDNTEANSTEN